ncbi:uncharacterized protein LOC134837665 [Culicoides brevitarsis]|uniref:uncharacterized protein LOC134837665 n=1 Tax=Culicoides brevitarsis TaxID=469753 RepID=UPI00307B3202
MRPDNNKKVNFSKIRKILVQGDTAIGSFILRDTTKKKTFIEKLLTFVLPSYIIIAVIFIVTTVLVNNFELMYAIISISTLLSVFGLTITIRKFHQNKLLLRSLFKWCENLYDVKTHFHETLQGTAKQHLNKIEEKTYKTLKWLRMILYFDATAVSLGYAIIGCFLPDHIYPKYSAPLPFYLPFTHQNTPLSCIVTLTMQFIVSIQAATATFYIFSAFFCIVNHVLGLFDIIISSIKLLKIEILSQATHLKKKDSTLPIAEWIKILSDMINDGNSIVTSFNGIYSLTFFILEIAAIGALFISGLLFTIVHQQYCFAFGFTAVAFFLFVVCHINEKILNKIDVISYALYDIPWYMLNIKDQKMILILINCDKIQPGFTALGVHSLNMRSFAVVLKAAYSNLIILKDLVQN